MNEPGSALDPVATGKIEDFIDDLKKAYTIIIVTHNMEQAARVSDRTAFFYLGRSIEYDDTLPLMRVLAVACNLERIADCATNIADDVIYMVEDKIVRHHEGE